MAPPRWYRRVRALARRVVSVAFAEQVEQAPETARGAAVNLPVIARDAPLSVTAVVHRALARGADNRTGQPGIGIHSAREPQKWPW